MVNLSDQKVDSANKQRFILTNGIKLFSESNLLLIIISVMLFINKGDGSLIAQFVTFSEVFIILLSIIACLGSKEEKKEFQTDRSSSPNNLLGMGVAVFLALALSCLFLGLDIPFPSTIIYLILVTNFMVALFSIIAHPVALVLYEENVFKSKSSVTDYIFKYIAILFSGINYHAQATLKKLPLILNKLIAIIFVAFLVWRSFLVIGILNEH